MTLRVPRTAAALLPHTFYIGESATDSSTTVTVAVTDATGASVASGNATSVGAGTGEYTFLLPAQPQLAMLTAAWTATIGGVTIVETDTVEICGGFLFGLVEGRDSDDTLADSNKFTTEKLVTARQETEEECELICGQAWVPRYRRVTLDGTGTRDLVLPDGGDMLVSGMLLRGVRTIRSAKVAPRVGQTFVALSPTELAALTVRPDGTLRRTDGNAWYEGDSNVVIEYEYGQDGPPEPLKRVAMLRFRSRLNLNRSGVPERAISFTAVEGGTYRIDLPGELKTGLPEVDAVYSRYSRRNGAGTGNDGGKPVPASRPLVYQPQSNSLFHRRVF